MELFSRNRKTNGSAQKLNVAIPYTTWANTAFISFYYIAPLINTTATTWDDTAFISFYYRAPLINTTAYHSDRLLLVVSVYLLKKSMASSRQLETFISTSNYVCNCSLSQQPINDFRNTLGKSVPPLL